MEILKRADVHKFYAALYVYGIVKLNLCPMMGNYIELNHYSHSYETRNRNHLILPFPRVNAIKINFTYQLINVWNDVPEAIKNVASANIFKKLLCQHFLST